MSYENDLINEIEKEYDIVINRELVKKNLRKTKTQQLLVEMESHVNKYLLNVFKLGISTGKSVLLSESDLQRCVGKTTTLGYLALKYDLPVITKNAHATNSLINGRFRNTNIRMYHQTGSYHIHDKVVLLDGVNLDKVKQAINDPGDKIYIGFTSILTV